MFYFSYSNLSDLPIKCIWRHCPNTSLIKALIPHNAPSSELLKTPLRGPLRYAMTITVSGANVSTMLEQCSDHGTHCMMNGATISQNQSCSFSRQSMWKQRLLIKNKRTRTNSRTCPEIIFLIFMDILGGFFFLLKKRYSGHMLKTDPIITKHKYINCE